MRANALARALQMVMALGAAAFMAVVVSAPAHADDLNLKPGFVTPAELTPTLMAARETPATVPLRPSLATAQPELTNDLLAAYASLRQRQAMTNVTIARRRVWSLAEARLMLARLVGTLDEWTELDRFLVRYMAVPEERATVIASSFAATLELIREGRIEVWQEGAFTPIYMRTGPNPVTDADIAAMEAGID